MRADRLLSILMLLQSHRRIHATQVAKEMQVSVRTVYRDIDALSSAGIPVYADRGPGGGFSLLEGYRTNLTGLTRDEVKALFMLSIPSSLDALGVSDELKAAFRKLAAALPSSQRQDEQMVRQRIFLDWGDWEHGTEITPFLQRIQQGTWENQKIKLTYLTPIGHYGEFQFERVVAPYGLVAEGGGWYLVCAYQNRIHVQHLSGIIKVQIIEEKFERPEDFELSGFWKKWCAEKELNHPYYPVRIRILSKLSENSWLRFQGPLRIALSHLQSHENQELSILELRFETFEDARAQILSYGRVVEVLDPAPLRKSVIDYAKQISAVYHETAELKE